MKLLKNILQTLPDGNTLDVRIGLHWTAVVVETGGVRQCGLASTLSDHQHHHTEPDMPEAGGLERFSGLELAEMALIGNSLRASVGLAAINALLPRQPDLWREDNAEEVIARLGLGKRVALIGSFPFVPSLRQRVGELVVIDQHPAPGDLPAEAAAEALPQADVVALTGMTLSNHTFEPLLEMCNPKAALIVLGPTTPLSPLLFEAGVSVISGSVVVDIDSVLRTVSQGGNFRQVHRAGVRLVNIYIEDCP